MRKPAFVRNLRAPYGERSHRLALARLYWLGQRLVATMRAIVSMGNAEA